MAAITGPRGLCIAATTDLGSSIAAITGPPGSFIDGMGYCVIVHPHREPLEV